MRPGAHSLPQLSERTFMTDGGLETTLIFDQGIDLPHFAAFVLLDREEGREALRRYYLRYADLARHHRLGLIFESPTWRASSDWGARLGYSAAALDGVNRRAVEMLLEMASHAREGGTEVVVSGCVGPRGDGYSAAESPTAEDAERYHAPQIRALARAGADMVSALTMTCPEEAIGICRAARSAGTPAVISFTVETDSRLPGGESLGEAITSVDRATDRYPAYYMINCAHPTHFRSALVTGEPWMGRIRGLRANASTRSHAELDGSAELDAGDPVDLGARYAELGGVLSHLNVVGGCCGTDHRHVDAMCRALAGRGGHVGIG